MRKEKSCNYSNIRHEIRELRERFTDIGRSKHGQSCANLSNEQNRGFSNMHLSTQKTQNLTFNSQIYPNQTSCNISTMIGFKTSLQRENELLKQIYNLEYENSRLKQALPYNSELLIQSKRKCLKKKKEKTKTKQCKTCDHLLSKGYSSVGCIIHSKRRTKK